MNTNWIPINLGCNPDYACGFFNQRETDMISCVALNMNPVPSPQTLKGIAPEAVLGYLGAGGRIVYFSVDFKKENLHKDSERLLGRIHPDINTSMLSRGLDTSERIRLVFWIKHDSSLCERLFELFNLVESNLPREVLRALKKKVEDCPTRARAFTC